MSSINISCVPALVLQFPQSTGLDDLLPFGGQPGHIMRPSERITCVATFGQMMIYTGQDRQLGSQADRVPWSYPQAVRRCPAAAPAPALAADKYKTHTRPTFSFSFSSKCCENILTALFQHLSWHVFSIWLCRALGIINMHSAQPSSAQNVSWGFEHFHYCCHSKFLEFKVLEDNGQPCKCI